jgi:hypothetical protein
MSYAFLGYKWGVPDFGESSGEITWSADLSALSFNAAAYAFSDFETQLQDAFQAWEDIAAIDFTQVESGADVVVSVGTLRLPEWVAVTEWEETATPGLEQFSFVTVTFDIEELWAPDLGDGFDLQNFYSVATHEIGHVIGLEHVDDASQLMFPTTLGPTSLQQGDILGAQILYGTDEGDPDLGPLPEPPPESDFDQTDDGGGGGGFVIAILGAIMAFIAAMMGGGLGPLGTLAAAQTRSAEDDDVLQAWGQEALDWMPVVPVEDTAQPAEASDELGDDLLDWV